MSRMSRTQALGRLNLRREERDLLLRVERAGTRGLPAFRSIPDGRAKDALVAADLIHWDIDAQRWRAGAKPEPIVTEATVTLDLSEYEASVITGALAEFGKRWEEEAHTASYLRERVQAQLPEEWSQ